MPFCFCRDCIHCLGDEAKFRSRNRVKDALHQGVRGRVIRLDGSVPHGQGDGFDSISTNLGEEHYVHLGIAIQKQNVQEVELPSELLEWDRRLRNSRILYTDLYLLLSGCSLY